MNEILYKTEQELMEKASEAIGKKASSFDINGRMVNSNSKGKIGQVIEEGFFGYGVNSFHGADIQNLGIEVKSAGYVWVRKNKQVSAKERLVITMINFDNDYNVDFFASHCYEKIDKMLLVLYEYEKDKSESDYVITNVFLHKFDDIPEEDKLIILNDYQKILDKIKQGKAHELSEADTFYLGACPKGKNHNDVVRQPFSDELAMKRAFSLKTSYMTPLLRNKVFNGIESREKLIKNIELLTRNSLEDIIYTMFRPYEGKTLDEIDFLFNKQGVGRINRETSKQYIHSYIAKMMNVSENNLDNIEEFEKANIEIKTIRVKKNGRIKESMSFPHIDFVEFAESSWEESEIRNRFESTKFLFAIFDEIDDSKKQYRFRKVMMWNMPIEVIESYVYMLWEHTQTILNGNIEIRISKSGSKGEYSNNFMGMSENPVCHMRPHGKNRRDVYPLPENCNIKVISDDGSDTREDLDFMITNHVFTRQCYWLNSKYVEEIIGK